MEGFWRNFWDVVRSWDHPFGQALFLLILLGGVFTLIKTIFYYISVAVRGWPPPSTPGIEDEDDDD